MKIINRGRYVGFFVRDRAVEESCLAEKVKGWKESVKTLLGFDHKHPQSAYERLRKSLQWEWAFVQRVTSSIRDAFGPVEEALQETFILALFQGLGGGTPGRGVTCVPVKQVGLDLLDTTNMARENWTPSCVIKWHLVALIRVH